MKRRQNMKNKNTFAKVLSYVSRYWFYVLCSVGFAAVSAVLALYVPIIIGDAIDLIVAKGVVDFAGIIEILKRAAVVVFITALSQWIMNVSNNKISYGVVKDIRKEAFEKLQILPLSYLDSKPQGDIVSRIISDVEQFSEGLLLGFTQFFTGIVTIVGTFVFMISLNPRIALVVVCITPLSLFVASFIAKKTYTMFQVQSETKGEQTAIIDEMIGNQKVVQAFSKEEQVLERFAQVNERLGKCSLRAIFFSSITNPATRFINGLVYTGVGFTGAMAVVNGNLTVGQLSCFLSYANQFTKPFNEISGVITELQNAFACAGRIFEFIEEESQVPDVPGAEELSHVKGLVQMEQVDFSYDKDKKLIQNLNLTVQPGQRVAIVGPTGCGKTTMINLLMRFYDVDQGCIKVDGTDIQNITRKSLRFSYGMVLQETWLRAGTIKDNLIIGKPDASEEEIIAAAKASHAHSFIMRMPKGYDTEIKEGGGGLSQGEKQLLCIARIMLSLPPMLILDEATSSIDTRTELKIQSAFARMMEGRTSFIVAHRLSTIKEADVILVMKEGNIIEQGNHDSLLAQRGFYYNLYQSQYL
ncbi:MAG: ABC transporter ATP-binding protein/permease [Lachnospiraceae bacterium]|nr:ABC transporter ATP-binding protein/permease [Lachnospiraceae bacterium]